MPPDYSERYLVDAGTCVGGQRRDNSVCLFSSPRAGTNNAISGDLKPAMLSDGDSEFDGQVSVRSI